MIITLKLKVRAEVTQRGQMRKKEKGGMFPLMITVIIAFMMPSDSSPASYGATLIENNGKTMDLPSQENCSCTLMTVYVRWSTIISHLKIIEENDSISEAPILKHLQAKTWGMPIKWCLREPSSHQESIFECPSGPLAIRTRVAHVSKDNSSELILVEYLEPQNCLCTEGPQALKIFPMVIRAEVMDQCHFNAKINKSVTGVIGEDAYFRFIYYSPENNDAPKEIKIYKDDDLSYPIVLQFERSIIHNPINSDSDDWRGRASIGASNGVVNFQLENITHEDQGTFFCVVKFLNSSSCFSSVNLFIANKQEQHCGPKLTYVDWTMAHHEMRKVPKGHRLILKQNMTTTFWVKRCQIEDWDPSIIKMGRCVSATTRRKHVSKCVPTAGNKQEANIKIDYMEDDTCSYIMGDIDDFNLADVKPINITRMERNGTCQNICQPENVTVPWESLRNYLNKYTFINLPKGVLGQDLSVQKCRTELSPCRRSDTFCDVARDKKSKRTLKLYNYWYKLTLTFYEAAKCKCTEKEKLTYTEGVNLFNPPVITKLLRRKA